MGMDDKDGGEGAARTPWRHRVQARLARAGFALGGRLPFAWAYAVGGALGALAFTLPGRTRDVTRVNLALCFPDLGARERARMGRRSTMSAGRLTLELPALWNAPRERSTALVRTVEGTEAVRAGLAKGRGMILLTPHFGSWELAGLYQSTLTAMTSLYKPPRLREMEPYYRERRARHGAQLVPAGPAGVGALMRALRRGECVGILPDQDPGGGSGVFAPFFGVPANTSVLVPRLARKSGAPVFFAACLRLPRGRGFRLLYEPAPPGIDDADLERAAAALNAGLERLIRRAPEQYLWSYKRFRRRPPGEPDPYRSPRPPA